MPRVNTAAVAATTTTPIAMNSFAFRGSDRSAAGGEDAPDRTPRGVGVRTRGCTSPPISARLAQIPPRGSRRGSPERGRTRGPPEPIGAPRMRRTLVPLMLLATSAIFGSAAARTRPDNAAAGGAGADRGRLPARRDPPAARRGAGARRRGGATLPGGAAGRQRDRRRRQSGPDPGPAAGRTGRRVRRDRPAGRADPSAAGGAAAAGERGPDARRRRVHLPVRPARRQRP